MDFPKTQDSVWDFWILLCTEYWMEVHPGAYREGYEVRLLWRLWRSIWDVWSQTLNLPLRNSVYSCLNSRPLVPLPHSDDRAAALTPGHFLIGRPMDALPDPAFSSRKVSLLRRWYLSQALLCQLWQRWSAGYLTSLKHYNKWHYPTWNIRIGDVVLQEDKIVPTKWPIAKIIETYPGKDGLVKVATMQTARVYKRPITKLAVLVPHEDWTMYWTFDSLMQS